MAKLQAKPVFPSFNEVVSELWQGKKIPFDVIQKRIEVLSFLNEIHPLELQAQNLKGDYTRLFSFYANEPRLYAPCVHYRVLPNEVVIELDGDTKEKSLEALKEVVKVLRTMNTKFTVGFSGNRSFHIHIIVTAPNVSPKEFAKIVPRDFRNALFDFILDFAPLAREIADTGVMKSVHSIRSFYSLHLKTMKWKTFVKPFSGYQVWELPMELGKRINLYLYEQLELKEILAVCSEEGNKKKGKESKPFKVEAVLELLKPYLAKDHGKYITYHCPFHPPDRHPSFVVYRDKWVAIDFHDGQKYSMKKLFWMLKRGGKDAA